MGANMQPDRRTDVLTAGDINQALAIDRAEGAVAAWVSLMRCGVPSETIQRVLMLGTVQGARLKARPVGGIADRRRRR